MLSIEKKNLKDKFNLNDEEIRMLEYANSKPAYKSLYIEETDNPKFLEPMEYLNWFNPSNEPDIEATDKGFRISQWNVLNYLMKISNSAEFRDNIELRNKVMKIIIDINEYKSKKADFNNYWVSYAFLKILENYPNSEITFPIIYFIGLWFLTKFDTTILTSEIIENIIPKFVNEYSTREDILKAEKLLEFLLKVKIVKNDNTSKLLNRNSYHIIGDRYWVNDLAENVNFINNFSSFSYEFYVFLVNQIKKTLLISDNYFHIDLNNNNTLSIEFIVENANLRFSIYTIFSASPRQLRYNFENIDYKKELLKEFIINLGNKEEFVYAFDNEFEPFRSLIETSQINKKNLALEIYYSLYQSETYSSLYDNSRKPYSDAFDILNEFLKNILLNKSNRSDSESIALTTLILSELINDNYLYFKKLFLFIVASSENNYYNVFWKNIENKEVNDILFEGLYFGDELKSFLNNLNEINNTQIALLEKIIERGSIYKDYNNTIENYSLKWKQRIYEALIHFEYFKNRYNSIKDVTKVDYTLTAAIGKISGGFVPEYEGISPLSLDEILNMSNLNIVSFINELKNLKTEDSNSQINGLYNSISILIKEKPEKFINDLSPFYKTTFSLKSLLLSSIYELSKTEKELNYIEIINFLINYFNSVNWEEELKKEENIHSVSDVSNFRCIFWILKEILKNDKKKLEPIEINSISEIIYKTLSLSDLIKTKLSEYGNEDYCFIAINSKMGSLIEAFIYLIRYKITIETENQEVKWSKEDKEKYLRLLQNFHLEAYSFLGIYINFFTWFDKLWLYGYLKEIENLFKTNNFYWKVFMNGYFWQGRVFSDIYPLMKNNYLNYLNSNINDKHSQDSIVEHLAIGYLNNLDSIEKGLLKDLLKKFNSTQIIHLVNFIWNLRKSIIYNPYKELRQRAKVLIIWRWLYKYYLQKSEADYSDDDKKILSNLCNLTFFLLEINHSNINWLNQCVPFVFYNFNSPNFIKYLDRLKEKGTDKIIAAKYVAELFLKMMEFGTPDYKMEYIISIFNYLNKLKNEEINSMLNIILNIYMNRERFKMLEEIKDKINN